MKTIRVLIIDDQATVRKILSKGLSEDPEIEVIAEAADPFEARNKILAHSPDVITLDIEMPKMSGLEFLKKLMPQYPLPVIMVSTLTSDGASATMEALENGAFDYVAKPQGTPESLQSMLSSLREKVKAASKIDIKKHIERLSTSNRNIENKITKIKHPVINNSKIKLIAIGASTGGTIAITDLLKALPSNLPGIVVVLHMPTGFTKMFADRLNTICNLEIKEAVDREEILPGKALIAPGDYHLTIVSEQNREYVRLSNEEKVNGHRPSVDIMFQSISKSSIAEKTIGVILTGMGADGAKGLLKMKSSGSITIGQDEATCVVYGMPKVAMDIGAVQTQLPLNKISEKIKFICGQI